jgi:predicted esterase
MRKALKSRAELVFVDAPYSAETATTEQAADAAGAAEGGRSWWEWQDVGGRPSGAAHYTGWDASQAAIVQALHDHAPVDGILGFSQGATAAALFLAHAAAAGDDGTGTGAQSAPLPGWAVLIGGFLPRDEAHAQVVRGAGLALPSLHVSGDRDALVPRERSEALWECFAPARRAVHLHPGAHMVPTCSGEFKAALVAFLEAAAGGGGEAVAHDGF